jgi:hypothetical protein
MDTSLIAGFIDPQLAIVVAVCWVLGAVFKRTPQVPDWTIIYIVTVAAVVIVGVLQGWTALSLLQGVLCGAVSVYGNQIVKQAGKGAGGDE